MPNKRFSFPRLSPGRLLFILGLSLFMGLYMELFGESWAMAYGMVIGFTASPCSKGGILRTALFAAACGTAMVLCLQKMGKLPHFLHRWRYALGGGLLALLVLLKISGSSIAVWANYLSVRHSLFDGVSPLIGYARAIRSDEWATFTPFCLSQTENGFSAISGIIRGVPTDVTTVYGAPSLALVTLFRPFLWGYILLGAERGLSFFWCGRLIALFLVSYDCARIYTKDNRCLSAAAAVMIAFSSTVQWWFSTNGFVEMLVFSQLLAVLVNRYMLCRSTRTRIFCALGMVLSVGGVVFTYYPAQEIPVIYLTAGLCIALMVQNWRRFDFSPRRECAILLPALALLGALAAGILSFSADTISIIMNTVYPGNRLCLGGDVRLWDTMASFQSLFLPLNEGAIAGNACEASLVLTLFPLGTLAGLYTALRKKDPLCIGLSAVQVFFLAFALLGFPEWLARLTLMSNVTGGRFLPVILITELMLFLRCLSLWQWRPGPIAALLLAAGAAACLTLAAWHRQPDFMGPAYIVMAFAAAFLLCLAFLHHREGAGRQLLLFACAGIIGLSGLAVNPVHQGAAAIFDTDLYREITRIRDEDPGAIWATAEAGYPMNNYPLLAGVPTIGSTNVYPAFEVWRKLDPEGQYADDYNRYCHIRLSLTAEPTSFCLYGPDYLSVSLCADDLQTLGIRYLLSPADYLQDPALAPYVTPLASANGYIIYRVKE